MRFTSTLIQHYRFKKKKKKRVGMLVIVMLGATITFSLLSPHEE